jgi:hypothetical protein
MVAHHAAGIIERCMVDTRQRLPDVADDGIGELVEDVRLGRRFGPAVVLGDRVGNARFNLLTKRRLELGKPLEPDLADQPHHGGCRNAGFGGEFCNRAEAGNRIVFEHGSGQLVLGARQRITMLVDEVGNG